MKLSLLGVGLFLNSASANIIFNHVPLTCDRQSIGPVIGKTGCLRGQFCTEAGTCKPRSEAQIILQMTRRELKGRLKHRAYSEDGICGPAYGDLLCDPNSTIYQGTCCSQYGWCGNTEAYCGTGCVSGCSPSGSDPPVSTPPSTPPRSDGRCGTDFGGSTCDPNGSFGDCCSQYGWCGSTDDYCLPANGCQSGCTGDGSPPDPPPSSASPSATGEPVLGSPTAVAPGGGGGTTTDGTCGSGNGNTVCGNWPQGSCCSMYGYCGSTTSHCGAGCQSGPCSGAPVAPAPGPSAAPANSNGGSLNVIGMSGVPAMHAGLMENGNVIFLDKVENYTQIKLGDGQYAYSSEYNPITNQVVGLQYKTNAFCSGGAFLPDGRWLSLGGNAPLTFIDPTVGNGFQAIRYMTRSSTDASLDGTPWVEPGNMLSSARWYASAQTMPDGSIFVASGSLNGLDPTVPANNNPTWELLNTEGVSNGVSVGMDILAKNQPYYMYPFIHLMRDGNLFVFVSKSSESFNVANNATNTVYPDLAGDFRTYPNTGGSVLLPLSSGNDWAPDIIMCGGGAYQDITSPTDPSCGRIQPLSNNPSWEMDSMPEGRGMVEGTLLPDGSVIWVNGCNLGAQGFGLAQDPTYEVLIYQPSLPLGQRWSTGPNSNIARLYHSVALILPDGTLMIAGSNPVEQPLLTPVPNQVPSEAYVTEFRVERYTPPYLSGANANKRPTNVILSRLTLAVGTTFEITMTVPAGSNGCQITLYHGGFVTHSLHMNHRMAFLDFTGFVAGNTQQTLTVTMPPNSNIAPPGPYMVFALANGVPAIGQFVSVTN